MLGLVGLSIEPNAPAVNSQPPLNMDSNYTSNLTKGLHARAPVLDDFGIVKTCVLATIAGLSLVGNAATLYSIRRTRRQTRSTVYMLISQLALADLMVSCFCATAEAAWTYTVQWRAGNVMCKLVKYAQMFSLYLSTFILVLIGLDRYVAVRYPMRRQNAYKRCVIFIIFVWILSAVFSLPQMIIFHVRKGPFTEEFFQCVTHGVYTAKWQEQLYTTVSLILMFIIPLLTLIISYICTFCAIARSEEEFKQDDCQSHAGVIRQKLIQKAKTKSLQITVVIVLAFVICWTPYYVMMIIFMFLEADNQWGTELQSGIFFFGLSNSLINPLIYGAFHLKRGPRRRSDSCNRSRSTMASSRRTAVNVTVVEDVDTCSVNRCSSKFKDFPVSNGSGGSQRDRVVPSVLVSSF